LAALGFRFLRRSAAGASSLLGGPRGGRTFSWFGCNRRFAKDFENLAETLATFVILASIQLAFRWLVTP
jgi:hypothetical protein